MPELTVKAAADLPAQGKVLSVKNGLVVFSPSGTNYELHLVGGFGGPLNRPVKAYIRVKARKVYTVRSGGNFIAPIFGSPRIVQGMVRAASDRALVVRSGCPIHVELPADDNAIDLDVGAISVGRMINVVCEPGARIEFPS